VALEWVRTFFSAAPNARFLASIKRVGTHGLAAPVWILQKCYRVLRKVDGV
jgi:hypothetical protein